MSDWKDTISDADRAIIEKGRWAQRAGFGLRPALVIVDAQNYMVGLNYFTVLPREAVFDRIPISHEVTLFDLDRCFADVVPTEEVLDYLESLARRNNPAGDSPD